MVEIINMLPFNSKLQRRTVFLLVLLQTFQSVDNPKCVTIQIRLQRCAPNSI